MEHLIFSVHLHKYLLLVQVLLIFNTFNICRLHIVLSPLNKNLITPCSGALARELSTMADEKQIGDWDYFVLYLLLNSIYELMIIHILYDFLKPEQPCGCAIVKQYDLVLTSLILKWLPYVLLIGENTASPECPGGANVRRITPINYDLFLTYHLGDWVCFLLSSINFQLKL